MPLSTNAAVTEKNDSYICNPNSALAFAYKLAHTEKRYGTYPGFLASVKATTECWLIDAINHKLALGEINHNFYLPAGTNVFDSSVENVEECRLSLRFFQANFWPKLSYRHIVDAASIAPDLEPDFSDLTTWALAKVLSEYNAETTGWLVIFNLDTFGHITDFTLMSRERFGSVMGHTPKNITSTPQTVKE